MGVSVDSKFSHAHWARSLGGVSFPLLSDFHPKGDVSDSYGVYLPEVGISARSTVIIDAAGVVRFAEMVEPGGQRDMAELAARSEEIDAAFGEKLPERAPLSSDAAPSLYIRSQCGFSESVLLTRDNLRLGERLSVRNVSEDEAALAELRELTGKEQAPCLVIDGKPLLESNDIIAELVTRFAPL